MKILVDKRKKNVAYGILTLLCVMCLTGLAFAKEKTIDYPFSAEMLTEVLEKVDLNWEISEEQSNMEDQKIFTLVNAEGSITAGITAAGDENGRSLMLAFMSKRNEFTDANNIQTPISETEFLKVLEMVTLLYGGFENEGQIRDDFQKNFIKKSTIKELEKIPGVSEHVYTYEKEGKWESQYGEIKVRANFGYMNDTGEMDYQSIGLYNSGDYLLFVDEMEESEVFEPMPEIEVSTISEAEFLSAYEMGNHESSAGFYYNQKSGVYKFFQVEIKDTEYCPKYPFHIKLYLGINLSEKENNIDRAFVFENEQDDYYFLPSAVNYGVTVTSDIQNGDKVLNGRFGLKRLVLKDGTGEVVQHKAYNYETTFEIRVEAEEILVIPTQEDVRTNGYPVNEQGLTYGPDLEENMDLENEPDLQLVQNEIGAIGYVYKKDLDSGVKTPEDAMNYMRQKTERKSRNICIDF